VERTDVALRPGFFAGRAVIQLYPGMVRLPEGSAPRTNNIDHSITVTVDIPEAGAEGVLVCMGGDWAGWSLFVDDDRLRYHYNWYDLARYDIVSEQPLPRGRVELRMELVCDDPQTRGGPATVRLFHDRTLVGEGRIDRQVRGRFGECLDVGEDSLSPVWGGYRDRLPFRFSGRIERVELQLGEEAELTTGELLEEQVRAD
jgi:arylsulfatase